MAKYDAANPQALKRLVAGGAQLRPFSPAIMEACYKAAKELHDEIAVTNADFKKVYDSMTAFPNEGYSWFQVAELTYDSLHDSSFAQLIDAQDHTAPEQGHRGRHLVLL